MKQHIVSLWQIATFTVRRLLKSKDSGPYVREHIARFTCPRNDDVERFLKSTAERFERTHNTRTYLIYDTRDIPQGILGYFSLTFKEVRLDGALPKQRRKNITGGFRDADYVKVFLIGQLAKNAAIEGNPLSMAEILNIVYASVQPAHDAVGGRVILAECAANLVPLYERYGFKHLQKSGDLEQVYLIFDPA